MHNYKPVDYIKPTTIANIYSIANQSNYVDEKYIMILSHIIKDYKPEHFNNHDCYVLMDNSLYENEQATDDLQYFVDLAEQSPINIHEIIIPDVMNDLDATIASFEKNLPIIRANVGKYNFMFVSQATTYEELQRGIDYINQYADELPNISIGFSKLTPLERNSDEAIKVLKTAKYPIHCLGIKTTFDEITKLNGIVRGSDSSQLYYIVKNEAEIPTDALHYERAGRAADGRGTEKDIVLETDYVDPIKLKSFRDAIMPTIGLKY